MYKKQVKPTLVNIQLFYPKLPKSLYNVIPKCVFFLNASVEGDRPNADKGWRGRRGGRANQNGLSRGFQKIYTLHVLPLQFKGVFSNISRSHHTAAVHYNIELGAHKQGFTHFFVKTNMLQFMSFWGKSLNSNFHPCKEIDILIFSQNNPLAVQKCSQFLSMNRPPLNCTKMDTPVTFTFLLDAG